MCRSNLDALCDSDGTFYVASLYFKQFYTLHVYCNGAHLPLELELLPRMPNRHFLCLAWFTISVARCQSILFKEVMTDFEKATIKAFWAFLVTSQFSCADWDQAVFLHISENRSKSFYMDNDSEFVNWLKLYFLFTSVFRRREGSRLFWNHEFSTNYSWNEVFLRLRSAHAHRHSRQNLI